jgi:hypothetical protein
MGLENSSVPFLYFQNTFEGRIVTSSVPAWAAVTFGRPGVPPRSLLGAQLEASSGSR